MSALFAYGTLQHEIIITHVLGRIPAATPVILKDFVRYRMTHYNFPGIYPMDGQEIDGVLFDDISPEDWEVLDNYEADFYSRETVTVQSEDGQSHLAQTYVVKPEHRHRLSSEAWDLDRFLPGSENGIG